MMRALFVSLIVGLSGCSSCDEPAAPAPEEPAARSEEDPAPEPAPPTPTRSETERPALPAPPASQAAPRRALLAEGRRLERAGDHAGAIERYERALAIAPGDATLLGELGWALFHAGRLDEAFEATRDAYERAESDAQRGALLYNLGRIAEALGQLSEPLELYRRSLAVRDNDVVRARIVALGGAPPGRGEVPVEAWVTSSVVEGEPAASLEALCDALAPDRRQPPENNGGDTCEPALRHAVTGERGILEAGILTLESADATEDARHHLVARTARGWFVVSEAGSDYYGPSSMNGGESSQELAIRDVIPGGPLELVATVTQGESWATWCEAGGATRVVLRVCGVIGDRVGCYLVVTTASSSRSGTWRDGEGWAAAGGDDQYTRDTCEDGGSETGAALTALTSDRSESIEVGIDEAGRVSFTGTAEGRARVRPPALAAPIELLRLPCLLPRPHPLFGCTP